MSTTEKTDLQAEETTEVGKNLKAEKKEDEGPTPAQIAAYEKSQIAHMKKHLPFLELQARYTDLMAKIEENHVRKLEAKLRYANYMRSQQAAYASSQKENLTKDSDETTKGENNQEHAGENTEKTS